MMKKCFTVETRLDTSKIPIDYFIWSIQKSSRLFRIVWKLIQTSKLTTYQLSSHLQKTYIIDKRSADSLIINAKARLSSIKKQKTHEMNLLYQKLIFLRNKIKEYHNAIKPLKTKATNNTISKTDLQQYRILKYKIWQTKQQFNRIKQKHQQYQKLIHCNYYPICFGTKKSFRSQYYLKENGFKSHQGWLNTFRQKRDSQIYFVGSRSDRYGNQNCQLTYDSISDKFSLRIRKDIEFPSSNEPFIVINNLDFKYQKEKLIQTIYEQQTPFTFRIIRGRNKWYIQVIFTWLEN